MNKYPIWVKKYIEIHSNPLNKLNGTDIATECNIRRETIYRYFQTNPDKRIEIEKIIADNLRQQKSILFTKGFEALIKKLSLKKVSDKAIQMALTVSGDYVEQSNNTNKYAEMKEDQLDNAIQNLLRKAKATREGKE